MSNKMSKEQWEAAIENTKSSGINIVAQISQTQFDGALCDEDASITSRAIPQPYSDYTEYVQNMIINGMACQVYWLFSPDEIAAAGDDEGNLDWSYGNVDRIVTCG